MRKLVIYFILISQIFVSGCQNNSQQQVEDIQKLKSDLIEINNSVSQIQLDMTTMQSNITTIQSDLKSLKLTDKLKNIGVFEPASMRGGYINIESTEYVFPIALRSLTKSPGGYEANFEIRNPYAATIKNMKIIASWGPNLQAIDTPANVNYIDIPALLPASWTSLKII